LAAHNLRMDSILNREPSHPLNLRTIDDALQKRKQDPPSRIAQGKKLTADKP
jgi:hypothetical protein